ncbi:MMPL family transporter [Haloglycomyces albus]|uniref:MMPL family transporter n=1 Tax=Haloglycomyces albus TaxID=526067 RepID=UPI00046D78BB|nr:MMPL family transporter [Haloglycomyces albus]
MYTRIGRAVIAGRWFIIAAAVALTALGSTWGMGVFDKFTDGGFFPEDSPVNSDADSIRDEFGSVDGDIVILYESTDATVDDPEFEQEATESLRDIADIPEIDRLSSYFSTGQESFVSEDRNTTYAVAYLTAEDQESAAAQYSDIKDQLRNTDDLEVRLGGNAAIFNDINTQVKDDLVLAEIISMPLLLVITLIVFGAFVAASMPILIGGLAILGGFTITHVIANYTDVSVFAANVITIIGLGMSIDYSLFVLKRFREELRSGRGKTSAILNSVSTAGRTVTVSGVVIILSMAGLLFIDVPYLHGIAYGVMSAVAIAMLSAVLVLPALLYLLGQRVDKGRLPWHKEKADADGSGLWSAVGRGVMKRPLPVLLVVTVALLFLASPLLGIKFGGVDERMMPEDAESRQVTEQLAADFPGAGQPTFTLMAEVGPEQAESVISEVGAIDNVARVDVVDSTDTATLFQVGYDIEPFSADARQIVDDVRSLDRSDLYLTGLPAELFDSFGAISDGLPLAAGFIILVTLVILFFAFGSIVLPVKAVLMNILSLSAAVGISIWIFQEGHLSDLLGFDASGYVDPSAVILMAVILFALSTDYEVFLLSRVREEWDKGSDNETSVLHGIQATGSIITAAAAILIVVVGAFGVSGIVFMKMMGVGMAVGIFVDATVVRMLLVPSTMRLLGKVNWWVPSPLAGLYSRYQISEGETETTDENEPRRESVVSG